MANVPNTTNRKPRPGKSNLTGPLERHRQMVHPVTAKVLLNESNNPTKASTMVIFNVRVNSSLLAAKVQIIYTSKYEA